MGKLFCLVDILLIHFYTFLRLLIDSTNDVMQAKEICVSVWNNMERAGWVGNDDLMLVSLPIRPAYTKLVPNARV